MSDLTSSESPSQTTEQTNSDRPRKKIRMEMHSRMHSMDPISDACSSCATSSSSSSVSASLLESRFSTTSATPAALYADAIHSILKFVTFSDLINLVRTNHSWSSAVRSLRPRKSATVVWSSTLLLVLNSPNSALLPHVAQFLGGNEYQSLSIYCSLLRLFPNINTAKRLRISGSSSFSNFAGSEAADASFHHQAFSLPQTLTTLHLYPRGTFDAHSCIDTIAALPYLRVLRLVLSDISILPKQYLPFLKLLQLQHLEELTVYNDSTGAVTLPIYVSVHEDDPIRFNSEGKSFYSLLLSIVPQLPSLKRLDLGSITEEQLRLIAANRITNSPQQLEWINTHRVVCKQTYVNTLAQFGSLTDISLHSSADLRTWNNPPCGFTDASFLMKFPQLKALSLTFGDRSVVPTPEHLVECMRTLTQLQQLTLQHSDILDKHMEMLLPHLVQLNKLSLVYCFQLRQLTWIRSLAPRLLSLELRECIQLDARDIDQLQTLPKLESLKLHASFNSNFDKETLSHFASVSPDLPCLREFSYERNTINDPLDESLEIYYDDL